MTPFSDDTSPRAVPGSPASPYRSAPRPRRLLRLAILVACPVAYMAYLAHYSVNLIYWDEWSIVPLVHAVIHHRLSFGMLWTQHNENRLLVANCIFVLFGRFDHFDTRAVMLFSGILFVAAFILYVNIFRTYAGRSLGLLSVSIVGLLWFSLEDWQNALWGFQMAWYLIIVCLFAMLIMLTRPFAPTWFSLACVFAVLASYSSLQGLILWPVGLLCLCWQTGPGRRHPKLIGTWAGLAVVTSALYFWGFNLHAVGGGSLGYDLHHPVELAQYFLAAVGNVIPNKSTALGAHEALGLIVTVVGGYVCYRSYRQRRANSRIPLPVALIVFAALFDISIAVGRLSFGVGEALSSRYTMANLLLLVGIASYLSAQPSSWARIFTRARSADPSARSSALIVRLTALVLGGFLLAQIVGSSAYGFKQGASTNDDRQLGARAVVNLTGASPQQGDQLLARYVYPDATAVLPLLRMAKEDHLSVFAPGAATDYRRQGFPG